MLVAYCFQSGEIGFCKPEDVPDGTLAFAEHEDGDKLREVIDVLAVHGWDGDLIIGSLRTAKMYGKDPMEELQKFQLEVEKSLP